MEEQIRQAFDQVQAGEELKDSARQYVQAHRQRHSPARMRRSLAAAAAGFLLVLLTGGGYLIWNQPVYAVEVDGASALELSLNRFDRVVGVSGCNEQGWALARSLDLESLTCEQALERILAQQEMAQEYVSVTVSGPEEAQEQLMEQVQGCTQGHHNVQCGWGSGQESQQAQQAGMSTGRYQTFLAIQALDPDFTLEQAQELSMGQLQAILDQLEGQEETSAGTSSGQNSCDSQSQGSQNGWSQTGGHHGAGHGKGGHE